MDIGHSFRTSIHPDAYADVACVRQIRGWPWPELNLESVAEFLKHKQFVARGGVGCRVSSMSTL